MQRKVLSVFILSAALILPTQISSFASSTANPYGAAAIDPPAASEVILTVSRNGKVKKYRFADLLKIKSTTITIHEPFVKKDQDFLAIPLTSIFATVGILGIDKVETRALNDYIYANTAKSFIDAKGYLAIKRNGEPIPYDQGGPIRIIFPNSSKWSTFLDPWNWSLMSISVK